MSLLNHHSIHNFFKDKELNHFYLTIAIITFGEALIGIFVPIYLYKLGYEIYQILFFYFLLSFYFVIFSYISAKIVSKIGIKHSILFAMPFLIFYMLGLNFIESSVVIFFVLPFLLSLGTILYNYGYHLNFIGHSKRKNRGREISFLGIITILVSMSAPLIGGLIASRSFLFLYITSASILFLGTIPLFLTKDNRKFLNSNFEGLFKKIFSKKERGNLISFSGYAIESSINRILWPIFLIIILLSLEKTGLVITLSLILSVSGFYIAGNLTDKYNRFKLIKFWTFLHSISWIGRIFADNFFKIFLVDSYKNISEKILAVPWEAHSYDLAKREENYFNFIIRREITFNFARIIFMPVIILIFYINWHPFTITFIIAGIASLGYSFINKK